MMLGFVKTALTWRWVGGLLAVAGAGGVAYACSGAEFSSSSTQGATVSGAAGADAVGATSACAGPEDCDDSDPCTIDFCSLDGSCAHDAKCGPTEQCCEGACGECCEDSQCDDGVACTLDTCVSRACVATRSDEMCASAGENFYCSMTGGCVPRELCAGTVAGECEDGNLCTPDSCQDGLCAHGDCPAEAPLCCPTFGCGECCANSQCDDGDPCTSDICTAGECSHPSLCPQGAECCPSADGVSATCGECCTQEDCSDGVDCTVDACTAGACSSEPQSPLCPNDRICDPSEGCVVPVECKSSDDCQAENPCLTGSCSAAGQCQFASACSNGERCCPGVGCRECCGDSDCSDNIPCTVDSCSGGGSCEAPEPDNSQCNDGEFCDISEGGCIECNSDSDCDDGSDCTVDRCDDHECEHSSACDGEDGERCCPANEECAECCTDVDCLPDDIVLPPGAQVCSGGCFNGRCETPVVCSSDQQCCRQECIPEALPCTGIGGGN